MKSPGMLTLYADSPDLEVHTRSILICTSGIPLEFSGIQGGYFCFTLPWFYFNGVQGGSGLLGQGKIWKMVGHRPGKVQEALHGLFFTKCRKIVLGFTQIS